MVPSESAGTGASLVACPGCHAQFDPTGIAAGSFLCHCGTRVTAARPPAADAPVRRCSACGAGVAPGAGTCAYCASVTTAAGGRLACPECFARTPGSARYCSGCGVACRAQPAVAAGDPVPCPVCAAPLTPGGLDRLAAWENEEAKDAASVETLRRIPRTEPSRQESPSGTFVDLLVGLLS